MIGIIVTGHGKFASGIADAVKIIDGKPECFVAVDYLLEDNIDTLEEKLNDAIDSLSECKEGIIIFSDITDGAPYKCSARIAKERKETIKAICGVNLGMLAETTTARSMIKNLTSLSTMALNIGKDQVMQFVDED